MKAYKDLLECENERSAEIPKPPAPLSKDDMKLVDRMESVRMTFDDVCGMDEAKRYLRMPLAAAQFPDRMKSAAFLLFGLPGTGKSLLLKALVGEARAQHESHPAMTFFSVSMVDIMCAQASVEFLKRLFQAAQMERPSIIFIEHVDGFATITKNISYALHDQLSNLKDGVFVIATTNNPQTLMEYPKILRCFNYSIYISLPNKVDRLRMLKKRFRDYKCEDIQEEYCEELAMATRGLSGCDINTIFQEAQHRAYRRVAGTSKSALITIDDIRTFRRDEDPNSFDIWVKLLGAQYGNQVVEPLPRNRLTCAERAWSYLADIFF